MPGNRLTLLSVVANCAALSLTVPAVAAAEPVAAEPVAAELAAGAGARPYRLVWDDFRDGFADSGPDAKWAYAGTGDFAPDDGVASTSRGRLHVAAAGANPRTGLPAFTLTWPQDPATGALDHAKWIAFTTHLASTGVPGFDVRPGHELSCETRIAATTHGTADHPFGDRVDPDDLRLASVAMNVADFETGVIFDFFLTNDRVYAFYERGPYQRATLGDYASFAFAVPVARRAPGQEHRLRISYDDASGVARWLVDGREVYRVDRVGLLADRGHMVLDHGGVPTLVRPRQLNCGMGMFTVLDAGAAGKPGSGLVRLSNAESFYFDPPVGPPRLQRFLDDRDLPGNRLFGQGASFTMRDLVISSKPGRGAPPPRGGIDDFARANAVAASASRAATG